MTAGAFLIWTHWAHSVWCFSDCKVWDCEIQIEYVEVLAIEVAAYLSQGRGCEICVAVSGMLCVPRSLRPWSRTGDMSL